MNITYPAFDRLAARIRLRAAIRLAWETRDWPPESHLRAEELSC